MRLSCSSSPRSKFSHWRVITGRMGKLPSHYEAGTRVWERKTLNLRKHLVAQLCVTLLQPHGLRPTRFLCPWDSPTARILEWVAIPFSRGSSPPRDGTHVSCIGRQVLYHWATREAQVSEVSLKKKIDKISSIYVTIVEHESNNKWDDSRHYLRERYLLKTPKAIWR